MENQAAPAPRKTLSKVMGSGIGSLVKGKNTFYVLEHRSSGKGHQPGSQEEVLVKYIELGRDPRCGVRFGDDFPTVSRKHAAITRENGSYILVNLSKINPTLLNGRPVTNRWYLANGDEIQLSLEGPRLGFIVPTNNTTGSLSIGRRMSMFRKQALRPYKTAITALGVTLLLVMGASLWMILRQNKANQELTAELRQTAASLSVTDSLRQLSDAAADSLQLANEQIAQNERSARSRANSLAKQLSNIQSAGRSAEPTAPARQQGPSSTAPTELRSLYPSVYLLKVKNLEIVKQDGEAIPVETKWFGTGFMTDDGRFITARHLVEPWFFITDSEQGEEMLLINVLLHNYGAQVRGTLTARSPSGQEFDIDIKSFRINRTKDIPLQVEVEDEDHVVRHALRSPYDIAYTRVRGSVPGLTTNPGLSSRLRAQQTLDVLGYPLGFGASPTNMSPIYSSTTVARDGLENESILTTTRGTDSGNSGGPVFVRNGDGGYEVVGVVSGGYGQSIGRIVPLSLIYD